MARGEMVKDARACTIDLRPTLTGRPVRLWLSDPGLREGLEPTGNVDLICSRSAQPAGAPSKLARAA